MRNSGWIFGLQCWFCHRKLRITIWHKFWTSRLVASLWPTIIYIPLTSITTNFANAVFLCLNLKLNYINIYSLLTCWGQTRTMRNKFNENSSFFLPDPPPTISQSMAPKISCFWIVSTCLTESIKNCSIFFKFSKEFQLNAFTILRKVSLLLDGKPYARSLKIDAE